MCSASKIVKLDGVSTPNPTYAMAVNAVKRAMKKKLQMVFQDFPRRIQALNSIQTMKHISRLLRGSVSSSLML